MSSYQRLQAIWGAIRAWYGSHSVRDQRILLGVALLVVLSTVYLGIVVPVVDFRAGIAAEIEQGQQELERAARYLAALEGLRAERASLEKRLQQARGRLLPGTSGTLGAAALQERANALAGEKGMSIQSAQVMREEVLEPYRKVTVRLTLSGELGPFAEMVSALEFGQQLAIPFVEITRRGAVAGAKGPRTLSATMEVSGFVLAEEAKTEETKTDEAKTDETGSEGDPVPEQASEPARPGGP